MIIKNKQVAYFILKQYTKKLADNVNKIND